MRSQQVAVPGPRVPESRSGRSLGSNERGAPDAAAAVVAVGVAAGEVGRGHERVALVRAAVLGERVHALLAVRLAGVRHRAVAVDVPRQQVHAVLRDKHQNIRTAIGAAGGRGRGRTQMRSCVTTTLPLRQARWSALRPSASPHVSLTCWRLPWARSSTTARWSSSAAARSSCWPSGRSAAGSGARKRRCSYFARIQRSRSSLGGGRGCHGYQTDSENKRKERRNQVCLK